MMKIKNDALAAKLEFAELLLIQKINGKKEINRWGFFAKEDDDHYAVYKPAYPIVEIGDMIPMEDDPGAIMTFTTEELHEFLGSIDIKPIAWGDIDGRTACGWYYDTETAGCEDPEISAMLEM